MATDSVSRTDQILLLLRQQLMSRAGKTVPHSGADTLGKLGQGRARPASKQELAEIVSTRVHKLRNAGIQNPQLLERALVEQLLLAGFGSDYVNEAKFQELVEEVHKALASDGQLQALMDQVVSVKAPRA